MRQIGAMNTNFLMKLHEKFDEIALKVKVKKMRAEDADMSILKSNEVWAIPFRLIAFCKNRIMYLVNNPEKVENFELLPWFKFKETLFDIYDHRI